MDVFKQRLEQEYDANVIVTSPNVPFKGFNQSQMIKTITEATIVTVICFVAVRVFGEKNIRTYGEELEVYNPSQVRTRLRHSHLLPMNCDVILSFNL